MTTPIIKSPELPYSNIEEHIKIKAQLKGKFKELKKNILKQESEHREQIFKIETLIRKRIQEFKKSTIYMQKQLTERKERITNEIKDPNSIAPFNREIA